MNMQRVIVALVVAASALCARGESPYVAAARQDPQNAAAIFRPYEPCEAPDTPPPEGYRPFYVSHYGRHGCRYQADAEKCAAADALSRAAAKGMLTEEGKSLAVRFARIKAAHEGMYGELTARGAQEHRGIARRMHARFGGVFACGGRVRCQSSTYSRCLASMANFATELKGLEPRLCFDFTTGARHMAVLHGIPPPWEGRHAARERIMRELLDPQSVVERIFLRPADAKKVAGDAHDFVASLFYMTASCRPLAAELDGMVTFDAFTPEEWLAVCRAMNARLYVSMGNSEEFGDAMMAAVDALYRDIVLRADEAIRGGGIAADLRFGHDCALWPLASRLGVEGVGDRIAYQDVTNHESLWRAMPMAANMQMAFYANDAGDVIVKTLYNEREVRLAGIAEVAPGGYCRWPDVKARLLDD